MVDSSEVGRRTPLPAPIDVAQRFPLPESVVREIGKFRGDIAAILAGRDNRLIVVTGPCSIHDRSSALEYARWLSSQQAQFRDTLLLVMRCYVDKPRTRHGWAGYVHDPLLNGSVGFEHGIVAARELLCEIAEMGVPIATEFVEPAVTAYIGDLISWSAVGARTVESPVHRRMASGFNFPVAFKNSTSGMLQTALDAMHTASVPHVVFGIDDDGRACTYRSSGLRQSHLILRGGNGTSNCTAQDVEGAQAQLTAQGLSSSIMVDCGHGNSDGTVQGMLATAKHVASLLSHRPSLLIGTMIESHIKPGKQLLQQGVKPAPDVSITDACIGLDDSHELFSLFASSRKR